VGDKEPDDPKKSIFAFLKKLGTPEKPVNVLWLAFQLAPIIISILAILKTQTLNNTVNFLQMCNDIQQRTDIVEAIEFEYELLPNIDNPEDSDRAWLLYEKKTSAIKTLLNTYELACQQYIRNKIDREAFKSFFIEMIKYVKDEKYNVYFTSNGDTQKYSAINKVYKEWYGN